MPRLTEASRQARREAIAAAALRVFARQGVAHASTADIIEELGGSAGGMYSHFTSKAELVRFIAERMLADGLDAMVPRTAVPLPPGAVLRAALESVSRTAPAGVLVQLWGEAAVDPDIRAVVLDTLDRIERSLRDAVLPWARTRPGDADARASRTAGAMRAIAQGYIVQLALFDRADADRYLGDVVDALSEPGGVQGLS